LSDERQRDEARTLRSVTIAPREQRSLDESGEERRSSEDDGEIEDGGKRE
jgi:hypothetical protein